MNILLANGSLLEELVNNSRMFTDFLTSQVEKTHGFPFCNVKKKDQDTIVVEIAVVGFSESELDIQVHDGVLKVTGTKQKDDSTYYFKGISTKSFVKKFPLSEYHVVDSASLNQGSLF